MDQILSNPDFGIKLSELKAERRRNYNYSQSIRSNKQIIGELKFPPKAGLFGM